MCSSDCSAVSTNPHSSLSLRPVVWNVLQSCLSRMLSLSSWVEGWTCQGWHVYELLYRILWALCHSGVWWFCVVVWHLPLIPPSLSFPLFSLTGNSHSHSSFPLPSSLPSHSHSSSTSSPFPLLPYPTALLTPLPLPLLPYPLPIPTPPLSHSSSLPLLSSLTPLLTPTPPLSHSMQLFFIYKEYLPKHCIWAVFFFAAVIAVESVFTDVLVFSYDTRER